MANNIAVTTYATDMIAGVPQVLFNAQIDDGRQFASGAAVPWGSTITQANTLIIDAAKAAALLVLSNPTPVFDGTTKEMLVGGLLTGTGL